MTIRFHDPTPLYRQVEEGIRQRIESGEFKPGERLPPQYELAQEYQVSMITVRRAINNLVHQGVLFTRPGKGTYVEEPGRSLLLDQQKTIGLVLRSIQNPYFSMILEGIEEEVSQNGYFLLLSSSEDRLTKEEILIQHFLEVGVGGLIIASMSHSYRASPMMRKLHESGYPYVMVSYIEDPEVYYVGCDHRKGAYMATEYLIKQGYRKIGYVNAEIGNLLGERRKEGFLKALQDYGVPFDRRYLFHMRLGGEWYYYQSGYEIGEILAGMEDRPEAVFVYNDLSALGLEQAVLDAGLRIPEDLAIIGFDDIRQAAIAPVPLTTVHQPTREIGRAAFAVLRQRMAGAQVPAQTILEPKIVVRESCGPKRVRHSATARDARPGKAPSASEAKRPASGTARTAKAPGDLKSP